MPFSRFKRWCLVITDLVGLSIGLVGLGFSIANICSDCIHDQESIECTLRAMNPSQDISCIKWMDIVGLVMSAVGLALAVVAGSGV